VCMFFVNRRFGGTYRLHLQGRKILHSATSQKTTFTAVTMAVHVCVFVGPAFPLQRQVVSVKFEMKVMTLAALPTATVSRSSLQQHQMPSAPYFN
jgi:23S rRNA C2498 (ribose-2'-O)-methylase RlmM